MLFTFEHLLGALILGLAGVIIGMLDSENELYNSASQAETARGNILVGAYRMCALAGDLLPRMGVPAEEIKSGPKEAQPVKGEDFEMGWFK